MQPREMTSAERVDTRVLQVVYSLPDDRPVDVYVGQQMDVFMKASTRPASVALDTYGKPADPFADVRLDAHSSTEPAPAGRH